jgi:hypothetical protein
MNDMKESYRQLIRENVTLKNRLKENDAEKTKEKVDKLEKKVFIYSTIIKEIEKRSRKLLSTNEMVEKAIMRLSDEDGEIQTHEIFLDGIFAVLHAANMHTKDYFDETLKKMMKCAEECAGCYICSSLCDLHVDGSNITLPYD